jgi:formate dehydrogenase major subunit
MHNRKDGVYLLPASTQFETYGSVTASNRSLQWREKVSNRCSNPCRTTRSCRCLQRSSASADRIFRNIEVKPRSALTVKEPLIEDITREFNRGMWTIGYTGQSPERLKLHMANQHTFDRTTLQARGGPADGDYYGLPWPSWGTPEMKHPGTPNLYDMSKPVAEGGLTFRARFGVEGADDGRQPAGRRLYSVGSEIQDGYPEFTMADADGSLAGTAT